jgi:hypothetical protein
LSGSVEKKKQHIDVALHNQHEISKNAYFVRLNGAIDTVRLLLRQGLPFRGHNEPKTSLNKGNYREVYDCLAQHDVALAKALTVDAADNSLLVCSDIKKKSSSVLQMRFYILSLKILGEMYFAC